MRWGGIARHNSSTKAEKAVCEPLTPSWGASAKGAVGLQSKGGVKTQGGVILQRTFMSVARWGRNAKGQPELSFAIKTLLNPLRGSS